MPDEGQGEARISGEGTQAALAVDGPKEGEVISIDPGHTYGLARLDGFGEEVLRFVKRDNPRQKYPGNIGSYPGTNLQEVFRACIDRIKYLNHQVPCPQNMLIINHLRDSIRLLEERAAKRHGREPDLRIFGMRTDEPIERLGTCPKCGHIGCKEDE